MIPHNGDGTTTQQQQQQQKLNLMQGNLAHSAERCAQWAREEGIRDMISVSLVRQQ
jgi:hypothetical protein